MNDDGTKKGQNVAVPNMRGIASFVKQHGKFSRQPEPPPNQTISEDHIKDFMILVEDSSGDEYDEFEIQESLSSIELEALWQNSDEPDPTFYPVGVEDGTRSRYSGEIKQVEDGEWWRENRLRDPTHIEEKFENQESLNAGPPQTKITPTAFGDLIEVVPK